MAALAGITASLLGLLLFSSWIWKLERREVYAAMDNLSRTANDLIKKIETSDGNARMTQEMGHILTKQENVEALLREATQVTGSSQR